MAKFVPRLITHKHPALASPSVMARLVLAMTDGYESVSEALMGNKPVGHEPVGKASPDNEPVRRSAVVTPAPPSASPRHPHHL